ncbi:MAG: type II toxin-antitoxin system RelE/ParE family toxin [Pararhizobium sp.]
MWTVLFHPDFGPEFDAMPETVQDAILARALLLEQEGPRLGRPFVDTLKGSRHAGMKELRFDSDGGTWRVCFAFDPVRRAVLLAAGDKAGANQRRFYTKLIAVADARFHQHLRSLGKGS